MRARPHMSAMRASRSGKMAWTGAASTCIADQICFIFCFSLTSQNRNRVNFPKANVMVPLPATLIQYLRMQKVARAQHS